MNGPHHFWRVYSFSTVGFWVVETQSTPPVWICSEWSCSRSAHPNGSPTLSPLESYAILTIRWKESPNVGFSKVFWWSCLSMWSLEPTWLSAGRPFGIEFGLQSELCVYVTHCSFRHACWLCATAVGLQETGAAYPCPETLTLSLQALYETVFCVFDLGWFQWLCIWFDSIWLWNV